MQTNAAELDKWQPYGKVKPCPANLRNWLMMLDVMEGKSPVYMQTADAIKKIAEQAPDEKAAKKKLKELEAEAWEDFLDMTISQAILWAASNVEPEKKPSEIMACDPYFIGSHSGASGAWVSGPEDLQTDETKGEYFWGYPQHDDGQGAVRGGRRLGSLEPQVLVGVARRRAHRCQGGHRLHRGQQRPPPRWTRRRSTHSRRRS